MDFPSVPNLFLHLLRCPPLRLWKHDDWDPGRGDVSSGCGRASDVWTYLRRGDVSPACGRTSDPRNREKLVTSPPSTLGTRHASRVVSRVAVIRAQEVHEERVPHHSSLCRRLLVSLSVRLIPPWRVRPRLLALPVRPIPLGPRLRTPDESSRGPEPSLCTFPESSRSVPASTPQTS